MSLLLGAAAPLWAGPHKGAPTRARRSDLRMALHSALERHIAAAVKEGDGFYLIEDDARGETRMCRLKSILPNPLRKLAADRYIVRAEFIEMGEDSRKTQQGALLVDFTLTLAKRGWRVAEQATYSANGKRFFEYTKDHRRVAVKEPSGPVEIKIDGGLSDEKKAPADGAASPGGGPSPGLDSSGALPHGDGPDPNLKSPPALDE